MIMINVSFCEIPWEIVEKSFGRIKKYDQYKCYVSDYHINAKIMKCNLLLVCPLLSYHEVVPAQLVNDEKWAKINHILYDILCVDGVRLRT